MQDVEVSIITRSEELPAIASRNFFHSKEFFLILEKNTWLQSLYVSVYR